MEIIFRRRLIGPELLDHAPPQAASRNLQELVRINRLFGGHKVIRGLLQRVAPPSEPFTVLDIGAASGDTARLIRGLYPRARVISLDMLAVNLRQAPEPKVIADAFALPFAPGSFDFVMCSLFLHHFTDERVVRLLAEFNRLARKGVLVSDLERHVIPYVFLPASSIFFRWGRITVHDGKISVRAAFRRSELEQLAEKAGICRALVQVHRPAFRVSLIGVKN